MNSDNALGSSLSLPRSWEALLTSEHEAWGLFLQVGGRQVCTWLPDGAQETGVSVYFGQSREASGWRCNACGLNIYVPPVSLVQKLKLISSAMILRGALGYH